MLRAFFDVILTTLKSNFVKEFIYRSNTFALTIADLIWVFVELGFFEVIYSNIGDINGWTKDQTFFFLGVFICADSLFVMLFQRAFWNLPYMINQGDLDVLLTKPISAIFLATFRDVHFTQGLNLLVGVYIIQKFGPEAGFSGDLSAWLGVAFWSALGCATQYLIRFFFVVWTFWLERGITVSRLYYQFYSLANKPEGLYPKAVQWLIKTALPFALIGSLPSQALLGRLSTPDYALIFSVLLLYALFCLFLWKQGLKRYQSASS